MNNDDSDVSILGLFFFVAFIFLLYEAWSTKAYVITIQHDVEILKLSHCYADADMKGDINAQKH